MAREKLLGLLVTGVLLNSLLVLLRLAWGLAFLEALLLALLLLSAGASLLWWRWRPA